MSYDPSITAILLVDPDNDFLSEGGKLWPRAKTVAEQVNLLDHLRAIVKVARDKGLQDLLRAPPSLGAWRLREMAPPHPLPTRRSRAAKLRQGDMGRYVPRRLPAGAR